MTTSYLLIKQIHSCTKLALLFCHKQSVSCVKKLHFFVSHIPRFLNQFIHISVLSSRKQVVNCKCSAFFQHPERFQDNRLAILTWNIVIAVIAGNCIKGFIRKVQLAGVSFHKRGIFLDALNLGIAFTQGLIERSILLSPSIKTCHRCTAVFLRTGNGQGSTSAAYIQSLSVFGQYNVIRNFINDASRKLLLSVI